jgi:hypothetical protein
LEAARLMAHHEEMDPLDLCSGAYRLLLCCGGDGAVRWPGIYGGAIPYDDVKRYVNLLTSGDKLLGLGGGDNAKKGAIPRRWYLLPRVARLVTLNRAELRASLAAPLMLDVIRRWGVGAGVTMDKGESTKYMRGGIYGVDNHTPEMKAAFANTQRNSNSVESYFGGLKYYGSLFTNLSVASANAVVAAKTDGLLRMFGGKYGVKRKRRVQKGKRSTEHKRRRDTTMEGRLFEHDDNVVSALMVASRRGKAVSFFFRCD